MTFMRKRTGRFGGIGSTELSLHMYAVTDPAEGHAADWTLVPGEAEQLFHLNTVAQECMATIQLKMKTNTNKKTNKPS